MSLVKASRIVSAPVAAAAYPKGRAITPLVHAVFVDSTDEPVRVLCERVKVEHILGDSALYNVEPVSCPHCKRLIPPTR